MKKFIFIAICVLLSGVCRAQLIYQNAALTFAGPRHNGTYMTTWHGWAHAWVDVVAPGSAIYSTAVNNQYDCATGTSMATPFVSGIAALVLSKNPEMTRAQVVDVIESTSKKISTYTFNNVNGRPYSWNEFVGYGLVDAYAALNATPYPPLPPSNDSIPIIDDDFVNVDSLNIVELTGITITAPKVYVGDIIRAGGGNDISNGSLDIIGR